MPDNNENTHFDFMVPLRPVGRVYFEVKYTVSVYSSAKSDEKHILKFKDVYKPKIDSRLEERFCNIVEFLKYYQIARNHLAFGKGRLLDLPTAQGKRRVASQRADHRLVCA